MPRASQQIADAADEADSLTEISSSKDLDALLRLSPIASFAMDGSQVLTAANHRLCEVLGYADGEPLGMNLDRIAADPDSILTSNPIETALLRSDGTEVVCQLFYQPMADGGKLVFAIDLTARTRAEREALESEKKRWQSDRIEALGRLAGGIAHDFNNFLAVLLLHVDILGLNLEPDSPARGRVNEIKDVANSIASTVRQLFAFGRKQPMTLAPSQLNPIVEQFADHLRAMSAGINVELSLDSGLGLCFVDQVQVVQVLTTLSEHAKGSMPNGGTLKIGTANINLDTGSSDIQPGGPYVQISMTDTGGGIEPNSAEHIFEPFFSTAESDKGKGLALAMVYGIVKQSKGYIWTESVPGQGTTFRIQFPRIDPESPSAVEAGSEHPAAATQRTVLLVDDESAVRRVTGEFLEMAGYTVLQAGTGMEALEIAQAHFGPLDLLLTDLYMPHMDGRELAERMARLHPGLTILFMSGNANESDKGDGIERQDFISKPFSMARLTETVHSALQGK
ncbi:MAG: response regulator [Acidobacteria bacterium]|nr:response regulator [Acidobacteriota bacterium]